MLERLPVDPMSYAGYFGRPTTFSGCGQVHSTSGQCLKDHSFDFFNFFPGWAMDNATGKAIQFAHGGSGILLTNKALHQVAKLADKCTARFERAVAFDFVLFFFIWLLQDTPRVGRATLVSGCVFMTLSKWM